MNFRKPSFTSEAAQMKHSKKYRSRCGADFPFGHIFPPEEALNDPVSKQAFGDEWFQFGCDEYFTFWLCRFEPDGEGMWFDAWDHDSETDPEPAFADLRSFLEFLAKEYEDAAW